MPHGDFFRSGLFLDVVLTYHHGRFPIGAVCGRTSSRLTPIAPMPRRRPAPRHTTPLPANRLSCAPRAHHGMPPRRRARPHPCDIVSLRPLPSSISDGSGALTASPRSASSLPRLFHSLLHLRAADGASLQAYSPRMIGWTRSSCIFHHTHLFPIRSRLIFSSKYLSSLIRLVL